MQEMEDGRSCRVENAFSKEIGQLFLIHFVITGEEKIVLAITVTHPDKSTRRKRPPFVEVQYHKPRYEQKPFPTN